MRKILQAVFVLMILSPTMPANSAIINVPSDQPTIQTAIDAAVTNDTVLVAP